MSFIEAMGLALLACLMLAGVWGIGWCLIAVAQFNPYLVGGVVVFLVLSFCVWAEYK